MTRTKPSYASDTQNRASDTAMSLTLRQMQVTLSGPVFWIIVGAAVLITAMAGPYQTFTRLSFPERLVYWGTTVTLSALLMTFLSTYAFRLTDAHRWNWLLVSALAGIAGVLPVLGTTYLAEGLSTGFGAHLFDRPGFLTLLASVAPPLVFVTVVVSALIKYQHVDGAAPDAATQIAGQPEKPPLTLLQSKLPPHLGHDIVCVQAQDHYVEVTTPRGSALVLMRLGDAVQDLEPLGGLRVHRSWWVSLRHIIRSERGSNGPELVLSTQQIIPVGRSFRPALKEAMRQKTTAV